MVVRFVTTYMDRVVYQSCLCISVYVDTMPLVLVGWSRTLGSRMRTSVIYWRSRAVKQSGSKVDLPVVVITIDVVGR